MTLVVEETEQSLKARIHVNEIRVTHVEQQFKELKSDMSQRLNNIEANVNKALDLIQHVSLQISKHEGAQDAKKYIWTFVLTFAGAAGALGLHTFIFKFFGVEI